jgi:hypothetical protein
MYSYGFDYQTPCTSSFDKSSRSSLSQQIRDFETELGIRPFDRTTRRVELTEGGAE